MSRVTREQLKFYEEKGWLHVRGVVSPEALKLPQMAAEAWVDQLIENWIKEGLVNNSRKDLAFDKRMAHVWEEAGKPAYRRSPYKNLFCQEMYHFSKQPRLLDLAEDLLGTPEISVHGAFNIRPKLPNEHRTATPWHQDGQFWGPHGEPRPEIVEYTHVITMWIPLQPVNDKIGCLQVAEGYHKEKLLEFHDDPTGHGGISPKDHARFKAIPVDMNPGDVLCFTQKTPHCRFEGNAKHILWSLDIRYEATQGATEWGKKYGFTARSAAHPESETSYENWSLQKMESTR